MPREPRVASPHVASLHVASVHVYPVKSTAGTSVPSAVVERHGLEHDRRWMVVDDDGEVVTARERHALLAVRATPDDGGGLLLEAPGRAPVRVARPTAAPDVPVALSRLDLATHAGEEAAAWFSALLGTGVRLVWLDHPGRRPVGANHGGTGTDPLSLADAGPLLLTTTPSLNRLQEWVDDECRRRGEAPRAPLEMRRFRPNVVVDGDLEPFAEDGWSRVRIGEVDYRLGELCDRCVMTTIDPETLQTGKEPLRSLARHRRWDGTTWFGVRLVPESEGKASVGDAVVPLSG
jgi:uncharacterized protein YcbX